MTTVQGSAHLSTRDKVGRWILGAFAVAAIAAGLLALLGVRLGSDRARDVVIAVIGIGNGAGLLRFLLMRGRAA